MAKNRAARNGTASYDPRELWETNVVPLVIAAREAAVHAARAARQERARVSRQPSPWWQRRWVAVTASGLVAASAAGGACAMIAKRRSQAKPMADEMTSELERTPGKIRSTVEAGRAKVAGATRTMMYKIRRNGEAATMEQPAVPEHPRSDEMPATGTGYGPPH